MYSTGEAPVRIASESDGEKKQEERTSAARGEHTSFPSPFR